MNNLFLLINVLLILIISANAQKNCPSALIDQADEAFSKVMLYGDRSVSWGTTDEEIESTCKSVKANDKKVKTFLKNCISGLSQQVLGLVLKGAVNQVKRFCKPNRGKDLFKHAKCGNSNLEKDHSCMDQFVLRLKDAATNLPDDLKLASSCCSFIQFETCIINRMENEPKCSREDVKHYQSIVHGVAEGAMEFSCAEYNSNPSKCDFINSKLKKINKSEMKGKSILLPLLSLIKKIA